MRTIFCVEHDGSVMTKAAYLNCEEFRGKPGAGDDGRDDGAGFGEPQRPSQGSTTREASMPISSTTGVGASSIPGYSRTRPGFALPPRKHCCHREDSIFPLGLLLFYIVYNGGKSRTVPAQPRPQQSLSRKKEKPL
jgi:hypothetical protein